MSETANREERGTRRREGDRVEPQPERREPRLADPGLTDLSWRDWLAVGRRAAKQALEHEITDRAAALAYYAFLSLPAALLVAMGVFTLTAGPGAVDTLLERLDTVVPRETIVLLEDALKRVTEQNGTGIGLIGAGFVLGLWTVSGAMTAVMRSLNATYEMEESRSFVRQRLVAAAMFFCMLVALLLVVGLLVLGPHISEWIGDATNASGLVSWVWWGAQWPILIGGLLLAFAGVLALGPNVEHPRFRFLTVGAVVAVVVWLASSALFAFYVSQFGSYNKTWGTLSAVVIMLTWLWLSGLVLLFGAEINAEAERSRELRRGEPAGADLTVSSRT